MLPWGTIITVKEESPKPVYLQIADSIISTIHRGQLAPGQKLPGTRVLGAILNLNRKTVAAAVDELRNQGWVECYPKKGCFVAQNLPQQDLQPLNPQILSEKSAKRIKVNSLPFLDELHLDRKNKIFIDDGVPDVTLAPFKILFSYHRSIISKKSFKSLLTYSFVEGDTGLRNSLSHYLQSTRGILCHPDNIFITRGSQMAIFLAIASLVFKNDLCITAFPGYAVVDNIITYLEGKVIHVPVDEEGIVTSAVETICREQSIKFIYTTPHHHYPTTVTLSPQRRMELLQLSRKYDFYIIEDDYDYDFHYSNKPVLPLASFDKNGRVIYIGSFSKCLSPSVRVGYFIAEDRIISAVGKLRRVIDRQGDPILERALSEFIDSGELKRHMKKVVKIYRQRRDYFCTKLTEYLSDYVSFKIPEGGMAVYVTFKNNVDLKNLTAELYEMGYILDTDDFIIVNFNSLRIGFASMDDSKTDNFLAVLKQLLYSSNSNPC